MTDQGYEDVLLISKTGGLCLIGKDHRIYRLATDSGEQKQIARDIDDDFRSLLKDYANIDE